MANKRKRPTYYAVRVGRKPGVYHSWEECEAQVSKFSKAQFKGFDKYDDAIAFVGEASISNTNQKRQEVKDEKEDQAHNKISPSFNNSPIVKLEDPSSSMPPPSSQSYFDQFSHFTPNTNASFDDEFGRFASSQGLVTGSQEFRRERTKAIRDELKYHYSSQPQTQKSDDAENAQTIKDELTDEEKLDIYQNMCREIGVAQQDSINKCRAELKKVLVNIVDYIDAKRIPGRKIEVWDDFEAFSAYTLQDEHRFDSHEAHEDGGFLSALLQRLRGPRRKKGKKRKSAITDIKLEGSMSEGSEEEKIHDSKRPRISNVIVR